MAAGSAIALIVSTGPVAVPNVVNMTQAAATTAISFAGLAIGAISQETSATVPSGSVISQNPAAGTNVAAGSAVALVVSTGPAAPPPPPPPPSNSGGWWWRRQPGLREPGAWPGCTDGPAAQARFHRLRSNYVAVASLISDATAADFATAIAFATASAGSRSSGIS